jgi:hypothetical protein
MKALDPNDLRCCFCNKAIQKGEVVAVVETPDKKPAVTHLDHAGVRDSLVTHPCQITTGALLLDVAQMVVQGISSDEAFDLLAERHAKLSLSQQRRLQAMSEKAQESAK